MVEKPGCRWFIAVVSLGFVVGMIRVGGCGQQAQPEESENHGPAIAQIGDFYVYENPVESGASAQINTADAQPGDIATAYARALDEQVTQGLLLTLAKKYNVSFDDKSILDAVSSQLDQQVEMMKMMAEMRKQLPQGATDQQFADYFKKQMGKTPDEAKKLYMDQTQQKLNDPSQRTQLIGQLANSLVVNGIQASLNVTDSDLEHMNDIYNTKEILFDQKKHPGEDVQKVAEDVLQQLKSHKITFDQAMDKSDTVAPKGKPPHESTNQVPQNTINADPNFTPIGALKPGQFTDVLPSPPNGYAIFELISIKSNVPPDFQKQKDTLRKQYVQTIAAAKLTEGLKELKASNAIKWEIPGWDVLYDWYTATVMDNSFSSKPPAQQRTVQEGFVKKGMDVNDDPAVCAAAGAMSSIWQSADAAEKNQLAPQYLKVLNELCQTHPTYPAAMLMTQLAVDQKDKDDIFKGLSLAADINSGNIQSSAGVANFADIAADLDKYADEKLLTPDQVKGLRQRQDDWRSQRLDYETAMLKQAQENAAGKAKMQAEEKKLAAQQKAQEKSQPKSQAPIGAAPPTTTPGPVKVPLAPPTAPTGTHR